MGIWPVHSKPFVHFDLVLKHSKGGTGDMSNVTLIGVVVSEFIHDKDVPIR